jgi:hypothetical protein
MTTPLAGRHVSLCGLTAPPAPPATSPPCHTGTCHGAPHPDLTNDKSPPKTPPPIPNSTGTAARTTSSPPHVTCTATQTQTQTPSCGRTTSCAVGLGIATKWAGPKGKGVVRSHRCAMGHTVEFPFDEAHPCSVVPCHGPRCPFSLPSSTGHRPAEQ